MKKVQKIISYLYLAAAVVLSYEAFNVWYASRKRAYLLIGIALMAVFMFFFKRYLIKKQR